MPKYNRRSCNLLLSHPFGKTTLLSIRLSLNRLHLFEMSVVEWARGSLRMEVEKLPLAESGINFLVIQNRWKKILCKYDTKKSIDRLSHGLRTWRINEKTDNGMKVPESYSLAIPRRVFRFPDNPSRKHWNIFFGSFFSRPTPIHLNSSRERKGFSSVNFLLNFLPFLFQFLRICTPAIFRVKKLKNRKSFNADILLNNSTCPRNFHPDYYLKFSSAYSRKDHDKANTTES